MSDCASTQGTPELYGAGIRVAFYLQWFGVVLGARLRPHYRRSYSSQHSRSSRSYRSYTSSSVVADPLASLRLLNFYSAAALFLSLVILTQYPSALRPAEIYIALLLTSGSFWRLVPGYVWQLLTCFRYPLARHGEGGGRIYKSASWVLLLAMMCFELWFWTTAVGGAAAGTDCGPGYGFLFSKVALDSPGFAGWNILFVMGMLIGCIGVLAVRMGCGKRSHRRKARRRRRPSRVQKDMLRELHFAGGFIIATTLTVAVELTVQWNGFGAAYDMYTAAQTIPLLVSAGFVAWLLWNRFLVSTGRHAGSRGSSTTSSSSVSSHHPRSSPGSGQGTMTEEEMSEGSSEESGFAEYDDGGGGDGGGPRGAEDYPTPYEQDIPAMLGVQGAPTMQRPPMAAFPGGPPPPPPPVH